MAGILAYGAGRAGPLSMEPSIGLATEYSSNPYLAGEGGRPVNDEAVLADAPTYYDLDAAHFALTPSVRYANSSSYASLASNYFHLNGKASFSSDLSTLALTTAFGRDSSLFENGLSSNGIGVRTDSSSAQLDWQRYLNQRTILTLDGGWNRVFYNDSGLSTGLVDYRYISLASSVSYAVDERSNVQISANAGQYTALNGITGSKNYGLQLGYGRQLTEIWTMSASLGYTRADNSEKLFEGPFFIGSMEVGPILVGTAKSQQTGPVYSAGVSRRGERVDISASASRAFVPSGFQFLSRQDVASLALTYTHSERWKYSAKLNYQETATPGPEGELFTVHYFLGQLSAQWYWTPQWVISVQTTLIRSKYDISAPVNAESTGASLQITRQFLRIDF
jgi:hypothetical protein